VCTIRSAGKAHTMLQITIQLFTHISRKFVALVYFRCRWRPFGGRGLRFIEPSEPNVATRLTTGLVHTNDTTPRVCYGLLTICMLLQVLTLLSCPTACNLEWGDANANCSPSCSKISRTRLLALQYSNAVKSLSTPSL